jgi:hypothetical protein
MNNSRGLGKWQRLVLRRVRASSAGAGVLLEEVLRHYLRRPPTREERWAATKAATALVTRRLGVRLTKEEGVHRSGRRGTLVWLGTPSRTSPPPHQRAPG